MTGIFIVLMITLQVQAATYYVDDTNGLDSNDGSSWEESWKTLARAYDSNTLDPNVGEGDTVYFKNGSYGEWTEHSGDDGEAYLVYRTSWITYEAETGHSPVFSNIDISGTDKWGTDLEGCETAWTAGVGDTVTADAVVYQCADKSCKVVLQSEAADGDKLAYINITPVPTDIDKDDGVFYWLRSDIVVSADDYELVLCNAADGAKTGDYVEFGCDAEATPGNWELSEADGDVDFTINSIALYANATIANGTTVYVDCIEHKGLGHNRVIFDGFTISNSAVAQYTNYIKFLNCNITTTTEAYEGDFAPYVSTGICVNLTGIGNVTIEDCNISYGNEGISVSGDTVTIKGNTIHRIAEDGLEVSGTSNLRIEDNRIEDIYKYRGLIYLWGTITGNFEIGETVIQAGTDANGVVDNNSQSQPSDVNLAVFQTNANEFKDAGGGGGTVTGQDSGATLESITNEDYRHTDAIQFQHFGSDGNIAVIGNVILREFMVGGGGLGGDQALKFPSDAVDNFSIINNVIWAPKPILVGGGGDVIMVANMNNNTFCSVNPYGEGNGISTTGDIGIVNMYNNIFACALPIDTGNGDTLTNHDNNIFRTDPSNFAKGANSAVVFNPEDLFTDPNGEDFSLAADSNAIDFGNATYAPATDILGVSRPQGAADDAGAYEYLSGVVYYFIGSSSP